MEYADLKQDLQRLLQEDISNRSSLQELRRNVFLSSEATGKKMQELDEKTRLIQSLNERISNENYTLRTRDNEVQLLQQQLEEEKQLLLAFKQQHEEEVNNFKSRIEELSQKLEVDKEWAEEINRLGAENTELSNRIQEALQQLDEQGEKERNFQKELNVKSAQLKSIQAEKDKLLHELERYAQSDLFQNQEKLKEDYDSLLEKTALLEQQLRQAEDLINAQNISVSRSESELQKLKTDYNLSIEELYEEKMQVNSDNASLIAERALWQYEEEQLKEELLQLKSDFDSLKRSYEEFLSKNEENNSAQEAEKNELLHEREQLKTELEHITHSLQQIENTAQRYSNRLNELEAEKNQLIADNAGLQKRNEEITAEQQQQLLDYKEKEQYAEKERMVYGAENDQLKSEVMLLRERLEELQEKEPPLMKELRSENIQLNGEVSELRKELEETKEALNNRLNSVSGIRSIFEEEKSQWRIENSNLQNELRQVKILNEEWAQKLEAETAHIVKKAEFNAAEVEKLKMEAELQKSIFHSENEALQVQVEDLSCELNQLNKEITRLNEEKEKTEALLLKEKQLLQGQLEKMNAQLLQEQLEKMNAQQHKEKTAEEELFIDKLFKQMDALNEEKMRLQADKEEVETEINKLQEKFAELGHTIELQKGEIKNLEETNKQIKLAQALAFSTKDKTATKLKINELVREIDKCIALLGVNE